MSIFSKKANDELFELLEADAKKVQESNDNKIQPSYVITAEEVLSREESPRETKHTASSESPLEALKKRMLNQSKEQTEEKPLKNIEKKENTEKTLLQKCKPYTVDEQGHDATTPKEPLYRLESVAEILENDSRNTMEALSKKYGIMIEDLSGNKTAINKSEQKKTSNTANSQKADAVTPIEEKSEITVSNFQTSLPDISDIDNLVTPKSEPTEAISEGATIKFTPIKDNDSALKSKTAVSKTNTIDLTNELGDLLVPETIQEKPQLEESEFDEFTAEDELKNPQDAKRLIYKLSVKKRNSFLRMIGSILLTLILVCFEIPPLSDLMLSTTGIMMGICTGILALISLINADMFLSIPKIFSRNSTADISASLAALFGLGYSLAAALISHDGYELSIIVAAILSFRSISQFLERSNLLSNLKQICTIGEKNAVMLIMDEATTFAMAKNAIEGDVLIAAPRKAEHITDFMKYSKFGNFINGKLPIVTAASLVLAIVSGFAAASLFGEFIYGLYAAAAIMCIAAMPVIFLIEALPLFDSTKRISKKGAMIAGKTAAERLEMANAVVLTSADLFPSGTVTLHNMKVLSENSVDDTILRAASLTGAVNSPLANIFNKIAGTNSAYSMPDSDTVKYEEKLGLSGWVDDELLFIGNRTLMESHGIEVPDVKLDKKILSRGYFPVYIASGNTAVALIVVQYSADETVVHELKKITDSGVTVLVNNCDPNITSEMICDYLGLYNDSVRIMSNAGVHMYKNASEPQEYCSAPAAFKGRGINFISIINSAAKIKKSITLLHVLYVLIACLGVVMFAYLSFSGADSPITPRTLMLFELGATFAALLLYQAFKP
ncbi:MAG: hypothetical protein E7561_01995 [Ruminococcaceae bacterium]|nr:hypothetical protein [Oscillospiraceae bacterium]